MKAKKNNEKEDQVAFAASQPSGARILIVEDHAESGQLFADLLEDMGYRVVLASSVAAALARADEPLDLVISDIALADGSGLDLLCQLRARRPIPAIAVSGYGALEDVNRSLDAGFQRHLVKPVGMATLVRVIEEVLREAAGHAAEI
jgi:DNA-binding response OmpR family regulator